MREKEDKRLQSPAIWIRFLVVGLAAALVYECGALSLYDEFPASLYTDAFIPFLLVFLSGSMNSVVVFPLIFVLWSAPQLNGNPKLSKILKWLLLFFGFFSLLWYISEWKAGVSQEGLGTIALWALVNGGIFLILLRFFRVPPRAENWFRAVGLKCLFFTWVCYFAFPIIDESL